MSDLPEGWIESALADASTLITKGSTPTSYGFAYQSSGIPFVRVENLSGGRINRGSIRHFISDSANQNQRRSILQPGDVLFSIAGTIGETAVVMEPDVPLNTNQALAIIRARPLLVNPEFLRYQFQSSVVQAQIGLKERGGGMNNVSLADLNALQIKLSPLAEQRRIVSELDAVLARVNGCRDRLDRIPKLLARFRQSVLAAACSGMLTVDWRLSENPTARTEEQAEVPNSWNWKTVSEIADVRGGIQKQPKRAPRKNAYPYLRVANVLRDRLDLSEVESMELFDNEIETYRLKQNDLLIVEGNGSISEIGRSALWSGAIPDCVHQNHIIRVRARSCSPQYLNIYWNSPAGIGRVTKEAVTSAGLYSLSTRKVANMPIPIPPLEEQFEIGARVNQLFSLADRLEARVEQARARVDSLTQSILAKAFRGELVPTEAELAAAEGRDFESAAQLLDRIRSQQQMPTPRRRPTSAGQR